MSLKQKTFSSVRWTAAAALFRGFLQVVQVAVLARLLQPAEYGLMAMVGVVLALAVLLGDLGLSSAYVHRQDVTPAQRASLFWVNVGLGALLSAAIALASPLLSRVMGDARLTVPLALSGLTCAVGAIGQQVRMTAEKAMDFRPVVLVEIGAAVLGFATAVLAAWSGWGVYSLVSGNLVTSSAAALGAWLVLARGWRPGWQLSFAEVRPYLGFGGAAMGSNLMNQLNMSVDLLLGGRLLGAWQLGLFSVPRNLILQIQFMINPIITRVGFPLIAQVQHDRARVRAIYLRTLNVTASTNAPIYLSIAFFAPEVAAVLLGGRWHGSIDFLRILAVWGFLRSTLNPVGSLLLGTGRADLSLKWNVGTLVLVIPALYAGSRFGPTGLAWGLLAYIAAAFVPSWRLLVAPLCGCTLTEYASAALWPAVIAAVATAPAWWLTAGISSPALHLASGVLVSAVLYWFASLRLNRDWADSMLALAGRGSRTPTPTP